MDTRELDKKALGFYRARLSDTDVLYDIIGYDNPLALSMTIQKLKEPAFYVMINTAGTALVIYEPVYGDVAWVNSHTYSKGCSGKDLKKFFLGTGIWLFTNTEFQVITSVVPWEHRRTGLFLGMIGATRQSEVMGTTIYTFDSTQVEHFKGVLRCHKD